MDRLTIINSMLGATGEGPVSSAISTDPSVIHAMNFIDRQNMAMQSRNPWWFNVERSITLAPDLTGAILLPANTLSVDAVDTAKKYVQRGTKLYDAVAHTYSIGAPVVVDLVRLLPVEELPMQAGECLRCACVYWWYIAEQGEDSASTAYFRESITAMQILRAEHIRQLDLNVNDRPAVQQFRAAARMPRGAGSIDLRR